MAAIILGMAYFLKYAIDNEWIGEAGRVMVGVLTGLGFVAWGESLHRKEMRGYAVTILGGGVAILYFSIFAAFSFYHLLDQIPALLLMVLITAATVVMSVRYDSKTIAIFATVGGFMTPALLEHRQRQSERALYLHFAPGPRRPGAGVLQELARAEPARVFLYTIDFRWLESELLQLHKAVANRVLADGFLPLVCGDVFPLQHHPSAEDHVPRLIVDHAQRRVLLPVDLRAARISILRLSGILCSLDGCCLRGSGVGCISTSSSRIPICFWCFWDWD